VVAVVWQMQVRGQGRWHDAHPLSEAGRLGLPRAVNACPLTPREQGGTGGHGRACVLWPP
jgi:hypothetical protein